MMAKRSDSSFKDYFSDRADGYAEFRPMYPPELVDYLAGLVSRHSLAWDCGCGSGQLSVPLTRRFDRVIATDASAAQLSRAAPHPKVEYRQARAEESGLPDASIDLAVSAQAAHWFDLPAYYAEVRRTARRDGDGRSECIVALICYGIHTIDEGVDPVVRHFYSNVLAEHWGPERRHVEQGYRSLSFPFDELQSPPMEIRLSWSLADMIGYVGTWSAARSLVKQEGRAPFETFCDRLAGVWGPAERVRTIRWPLSLRVGRV
jgi:SAM-dependent methyltransferase